MQPLTEAQIRESFVNVSKGDAARVPMPGLHEVVWDEREYLGWHDAKAPQPPFMPNCDIRLAIDWRVATFFAGGTTCAASA